MGSEMCIRDRDIFGAAFLLKASFRYFPKSSIFLTVVDPGVGTERYPIIIRTRDYFFVGPDNGVLSLAASEDKIKEIVRIENKKYILESVSDTFHGRDIFAPASAYLSRGKSVSCFGQRLSAIKHIDLPEPTINKNILKGEVVYIDRFGNLVTNIPRDLFVQFIEDKDFQIQIQDKKIDSISTSYQEVKGGEPLAIFGSFGYLEISVNQGSAEEYFNADRAEGVWVVKYI